MMDPSFNKICIENKSQYHNYPKYSTRHVWANRDDPDQTLQNAKSVQGQPYLPLIWVVLDTPTGSKMDYQILVQVW